MKSILDNETRAEIIQRIGALNESCTAQGGKMNVRQMLRHCILCEEMFLGKKKYKRLFIGRIFGKIGLKNMLKDEKPFGRNAPTGTAFRNLTPSGDLTLEKEKWISLICKFK